MTAQDINHRKLTCTIVVNTGAANGIYATHKMR